ncbi:MAG: peptide-methionine (S)-S-oxide reductase MsrA [Aristaeellaceae bacterium]
MSRKTIYLAGGCYWGVEKYVSSIRGVVETEVGFANGTVREPSYARVCQGDTGHAETVRVAYDGDVLPLARLLSLFFRIIDPVSVDRQGEDAGNQYRTGIYWADEADAPVVDEALSALEQQMGQPLAVEHGQLRCFYPAEEEHQQYLDKNPGGYCHVPWDMIRWVKEQE